ncbi:MAG: hypothetical protein JW966_02650 [Anaerolineae bacterium]|nr:hypothetical protein [Anaerolineae bacterium]
MGKSKASKAKTNSGNTITIGLDIGYGVVKALTDDEAVVFPSVMSHARELKFGQDTIHDKYPGDQITDDHGSWFVGDLALSQVPPGELLRLRGRTANEKTMGNAFRLRLAKVAIGKLMSGIWNREPVHLRISSGLPVDHMPDAAELKTALLGQHLMQPLRREWETIQAETAPVREKYDAVLRDGRTKSKVCPAECVRSTMSLIVFVSDSGIV